jgi:hypothetical protein
VTSRINGVAIRSVEASNLPVSASLAKHLCIAALYKGAMWLPPP